MDVPRPARRGRSAAYGRTAAARTGGGRTAAAHTAYGRTVAARTGGGRTAAAHTAYGRTAAARTGARVA
ncbi:hypothetical protein [Streptomyces sp. NRRL S-813]|uniref:hypothetical protein n=1 Tax=Streptomyces sp. NRRL S-813 TaxID=1463919 RepID=UPI000A4228A7|nr:hypothetical protein [Streptomyces sp. NRRL S-813]